MYIVQLYNSIVICTVLYVSALDAIFKESETPSNVYKHNIVSFSYPRVRPCSKVTAVLTLLRKTTLIGVVPHR